MTPAYKDLVKFLKQRGWTLIRQAKGGHQLWGKGDLVYTVSTTASWDLHAVRRRLVKLEETQRTGAFIYQAGPHAKE